MTATVAPDAPDSQDPRDAPPSEPPDAGTGRVSKRLVLAALGVVFGDIGTSPLYALKTCFTTASVAPAPENVLGILSLIVWALVLVVCLKYVATLLRIDHHGEGGILALLALAQPPKILGVKRGAGALIVVVVLGAAMLIGDGIITPAISVISAVEGLDVATKAAHPFIVPISLAILVALFAIQSRGTERVGRLFGPVMLLWFAAIAASGVVAIVRAPRVLAALNPLEGARFVTHHGVFGFLVFGAVVLCITGVEALYADLSHFGRKPIMLGWYALVFPALLCNYLGQGALLLASPKALDAPFFALVPPYLTIAMVVLATAATVIASQALISGAFTLTEQAIALNLWPRLQITHTSKQRVGQVFVPTVNWALAIGCIALVVAFRSSDRLAAAYGLAVAGTMTATSIAFFNVVRRRATWKAPWPGVALAAFLAMDGTFLTAALPKLADGAWIPLVLAVVFATVALTWLEGRRAVAQSLASDQMPIDAFLGSCDAALDPAHTGSMVFLTSDTNGVPFMADHRWLRERARRERIVLLTLTPASQPYVEPSERIAIKKIADRLVKVTAKFGYMERPRIEPVVTACARTDLHLDDDETSFFYADPKISRAAAGGFPAWRRNLFILLFRNARPLPDELRIAAAKRVEIGVDVAI